MDQDVNNVNNSTASEINFDGIVGPTHNYAGLAIGNIASQTNKGLVSNPKQAALQGLKKAKLLADLGVLQAVLPPNPRPNLRLLRALGFSGSDQQIIARAYRQAPELLIACYSASNMWSANLATVSPSANTADGKVHLTIANLISNMHRAQEAVDNAAVLRQIFADQRYFQIHAPLLSCRQLSDEGAANHSVICSQYGSSGVELFVYGAKGFGDPKAADPALQGGVVNQIVNNASVSRVVAGQNFYPRQMLEASQAVARLHQLAPQRTVFAQQHPQAIMQGVFHNDVVFVANQNVVLYHELAFVDSERVIADLQLAMQQAMQQSAQQATQQLMQQAQPPITVIKIKQQDFGLTEAVSTYLFNSQLINIAHIDNNAMAIIAPEECRRSSTAAAILEHIVADQSNPISAIHYVDCRQSMLNGGGPACLRLRVILTSEEMLALTGKVMLTAEQYTKLTTWVERHYRDRLTMQDLADPQLADESFRALDELAKILNLNLLT